MLDFTKRDLFKAEKRQQTAFHDKKCKTAEEYDTMQSIEDNSGDGFGAVGMDSFLENGGIDIEADEEVGGSGGGFGGFGFGFDDDNEEDEKPKGRESYLAGTDRSHETGVWWKDILYSPFFLVLEVTKELMYNKLERNDVVSILLALNKITLFSTGASFILWLLDFKFIFNLGFQCVTSLIMFMVSYGILRVVLKENVSVFGKLKDSTGDEDEEDEDDPLGGFGESISSDMAMGFGSGDGLGFDIGGQDDFSSLFADIDSSKENYKSSVNTDVKILAKSPIDISSTEKFNRSLLKVYGENAEYAGKEFRNRRELLDSLHGYVITNDDKFGSWNILNNHSSEYANITYALYKGLCQIKTTFATDEELMIVYDLKENPLLYRLEVKLPIYFTQDIVKKKVKEIESMIQKDSDDVNVSVLVTYSGGKFTFKFLRLENKGLISLGDIFRFYDEEKGSTPLDEFAKEEYGMPILIGLRDNETPMVIDFENNTSGVVVGGSGSGKSWLTFSIMFNFVLACDYTEVNMVIFDKKNAPFWNNFAKFPHVLGYHTDTKQYLAQIHELYSEIDRRKDLLTKYDAENFKMLRKRLKKKAKETGDYSELDNVPLLVIIIDEITSTMDELEAYYGEENKDLFKEYRGVLAKITQEGRSLGVRLLCIGQRAVDKSIPKAVMMNSSMRFGMKVNKNTEYEFMYGKDADNIPKPQSAGLGLMASEDFKGIQSLKTLTVGGADEDQITKVIRVVALEWVRRSMGRERNNNLAIQPPGMNIPLCFNRGKFAEKSIYEIENGYILSKSEEDRTPEYAFDPSVAKRANEIKRQAIEVESEEVKEDVFQTDRPIMGLGFTEEVSEEVNIKPIGEGLSNISNISDAEFDEDELFGGIEELQSSIVNEDTKEGLGGAFDDTLLDNDFFNMEDEEEEEEDATFDDDLSSIFSSALDLFETVDTEEDTDALFDEVLGATNVTDAMFDNLILNTTDIEGLGSRYVEDEVRELAKASLKTLDSYAEDVDEDGLVILGDNEEDDDEELVALKEGLFNETYEEINEEEAVEKLSSVMEKLRGMNSEVGKGTKEGSEGTEEGFNDNDFLALFEEDDEDDLDFTFEDDEDEDIVIDFGNLTEDDDEEEEEDDFNYAIADTTFLDTSEIEEPDMPIKMYILKNGSKKGLKARTMGVDELSQVYKAETIDEALSLEQITLNDGLYIARI